MENMFIIGFTLAILGNIHKVATEALTQCPDDWTAYEGSCYSFHSHNATFTEAEHYCQNHRAHLVHVNDDIENSFLRNEIQERKAEVGWWIGLTDEEVEKVYRWTDTNDILTQEDYTDWATGEPNDAGHHEDCVHIYSAKDWHWNDYICTQPQPFICEQNPETELGIIG